MVLSTRQMSVSCAEVEFILSPPKARSPCLQRACTFAAEQVCGGCVLCITHTSVAPGTLVGGTAVEVPAGIKVAFTSRPNHMFFRASSRTDGRTDGHRHTIIRLV